MKLFRSTPLILGLLLVSAPGLAQEPLPPTVPTPPPVIKPDISEMTARLRSFITDEEMELLYDFMSDSAIAALGGDEVEPLPPELEFKLAILRERLYKEGNAAMQSLMLFLQREFEDTLKKFQSPAPAPAPPRPLPDPS
jgi:hypothetical protein